MVYWDFYHTPYDRYISANTLEIPLILCTVRPTDPLVRCWGTSIKPFSKNRYFSVQESCFAYASICCATWGGGIHWHTPVTGSPLVWGNLNPSSDSPICQKNSTPWNLLKPWIRKNCEYFKAKKTYTPRNIKAFLSQFSGSSNWWRNTISLLRYLIQFVFTSVHNHN